MLSNLFNYCRSFVRETNLSKVVIVILNARIMYLNNDLLKKKIISNKFYNLIVRINKKSLF